MEIMSLSPHLEIYQHGIRASFYPLNKTSIFFLMTTQTNSTKTLNSSPCINTSAQAPFKLTIINYVFWKLQFQTLFIGYNLFGYVDGSKPCPLVIIMANTQPYQILLTTYGFIKISSSLILSLAHFLLQSFH